jgi:hypothetical protein
MRDGNVFPGNNWTHSARFTFSTGHERIYSSALTVQRLICCRIHSHWHLLQNEIIRSWYLACYAAEVADFCIRRRSIRGRFSSSSFVRPIAQQLRDHAIVSRLTMTAFFLQTTAR